MAPSWETCMGGGGEGPGGWLPGDVKAGEGSINRICVISWHVLLRVIKVHSFMLEDRCIYKISPRIMFIICLPPDLG